MLKMKQVPQFWTNSYYINRSNCQSLFSQYDWHSKPELNFYTTLEWSVEQGNYFDELFYSMVLVKTIS